MFCGLRQGMAAQDLYIFFPSMRLSNFELYRLHSPRRIFLVLPWRCLISAATILSASNPCRASFVDAWVRGGCVHTLLL